MHQLKTSDVVNPTMIAKTSFENILETIQSSNLNFQLQVSPFSATIFLKKSAIKDKNGNPLLPPKTSPTRLPQPFMSEIAALASKNQKLENDFLILKNNYDFCVEECKNAYATIDSLQTQLAAENVEIKTETSDLVTNNYIIEKKHLESELKQLEQENFDDKSMIANQKMKIQNLEQSIKKQKEISQKFAKELSENKARFKKEKCSILKQHKSAIKYWRNELGEEIRLKIKAEEMLKKPVENSKEPVIQQSVDPPPMSTFEEPTTQPNSSEINFICTICAQIYLKSYLSEKSEPEERDTCKGCNKESDLGNESDIPKLKSDEVLDLNDSIENISRDFEEFLANFADDKSGPKYERKVMELVESSEYILDVSCSDIRNHNLSLRKSLQDPEHYKILFPHLCRTIKLFVEQKFGQEAAKEYYLLRMM